MSFDVKLDENGDIYAQTRYVDGTELVVQRIENRLLTHRGEYILDTRVGLPYQTWLAQKPVPLEEIADAVRFEIETTPGVEAIESFEADLDGRTVEITGRVRTSDGQSIDVAISNQSEQHSLQLARVKVV